MRRSTPLPRSTVSAAVRPPTASSLRITMAAALLAGAGLAAVPSAADAWTGPTAEAPPRKPELPADAMLIVSNAPTLPKGADEDLRAVDARARGGDIDAQVELAEHFVSGTRPGSQDVKRAIFWYEAAAERGDADAAWALAALYRNRDELVPNGETDMVEAVRWYREAAQRGHAEAMYDLGLLFAEGDGIIRDPVQAVQWFEAAADAGVARALFMLGILYENGVDGAPDLETAAGWYAQAAATGDTTAEAALKRLADGQGNVLVAQLPLEVEPASLRPPGEEPRVARPAPPPKPTDAIPVNRTGVREIQRLLTSLGYRPGKADGHLGKRTATAIRAYQKAEKLPVDGRATQGLLEHLRARSGA